MTIKTETAVIVIGRENVPALATPTRDLIWTSVRDSDGLQVVEVWRRNSLIATLQVWEVPA